MSELVTVSRKLAQMMLNEQMSDDMRQEFHDALSAPVQQHTGRKVYVCKDCNGVYADAPVTSCDCNGSNIFDEYVISPVQQQEPAAIVLSREKLLRIGFLTESGKELPHGTKLYTHPAPADALVEALEACIPLLYQNFTNNDTHLAWLKATDALATVKGEKP